MNKYNTKDSSNEKVLVPTSSRINDRKMNLPDNGVNSFTRAEQKADATTDQAESGIGTFLSFFLPIAMILTIIFWVFYAYRNPHTKSGQLLIQVIKHICLEISKLVN